MLQLEKRVIVVTGAARGQGRVEAEHLAARGAIVIGVDLSPPDEPMAPGIIFRTLDITKEGQWRTLAEDLEKDYGSVFGLVNNAGISGSRGEAGRLENITVESLNKLFEVNVTGSLLGIQKLSPKMHHGGSIVNIASIAAAGAHFAAGYSMSKWAVRGLSRIASMELGPKKIRVNCIMPGYIQSAMQHDSTTRFIDAHLSMIPLGRTGSADDVAPLVSFLMSDDAAWISGVEIPIDGGAMGHGGLRVLSEGMRAAPNSLAPEQ